MTDWSDDVEARLEEDIANLPSISEHAADIRAALEEIRRLRVHSERQSGVIRDLTMRAEAAEAETERLREEARLNRAAAEKHYAYGEAQKERAEAAEAAIVAALDESTVTKVLKLRIEELKARIEELEGDRNYAYRAKHELEAEAERLREAAEDAYLYLCSPGLGPDTPKMPLVKVVANLRAALRGGGE